MSATICMSNIGEKTTAHTSHRHMTSMANCVDKVKAGVCHLVFTPLQAPTLLSCTQHQQSQELQAELENMMEMAETASLGSRSHGSQPRSTPSGGASPLSGSRERLLQNGVRILLNVTMCYSMCLNKLAKSTLMPACMLELSCSIGSANRCCSLPNYI